MFASFNHNHSPKPMSEINMVPLIDVMLVLLVIFMVTAPFFTHALRLNLPRSDAASYQTTPEKLDISIDSAGQLYFNGKALPREALRALLRIEAQKSSPPAVHVRADQSVSYQRVTEILSDCARAGLTQIGLVMAPEVEM